MARLHKAIGYDGSIEKLPLAATSKYLKPASSVYLIGKRSHLLRLAVAIGSSSGARRAKSSFPGLLTGRSWNIGLGGLRAKMAGRRQRRAGLPGPVRTSALPMMQLGRWARWNM